MEDKPFRVLLDFTEINTGTPTLKYVWMHVSPREFQTIYDFKQAIIKKFSFSQEDFKLFLRSGLLLETEKIFVLREDDTIRLQFEALNEQSMEGRVEYTKSEVSTTENCSNPASSSNIESLMNSLKRKSDILTNSASETNTSHFSRSKKRKKQGKSSYLSNESNNIYTTLKEASGYPLNLPQGEQSDKSVKPSTSNNSPVQLNKNVEQPKKHKKKSCNRIPTNDFIAFAVKLSESENNNQSTAVIKPDTSFERTVISNANVSSIFEQTSNEIPTNKTEILEEDNKSELNSVSEIGKSFDGKKRRRRKRKRKENSLAQDTFLPEETTTEMETETSNLSSVISNQTFNSSSATRKHVIYQSPTKFSALDSNAENDVKNVSDLNSSKKEALSKDIDLDDQLLQKSYEFSAIKFVDSPKESTPFSKKKLKGQPWGVTPLPKISNGASDTFSIEDVNSSKNETIPKLQYKDCTLLNCVPAVGTHLIFKTLELTEDYQPEITEYKEGILKKFDPKTDELEIELIQEEVKPGRLGKFENVWKDEEPPANQVVKMVSLNWTALIEPRLLDQ